MNRLYSRRRFIRRYLFITSSFIGGTAVSCSQGESSRKEGKPVATIRSCDDFSGVTENNKKTREKLGYVNESPIEDMTCNKCNLWLPPEGDKPCGGCMLFKGPVQATGYCTYWTAKQA